MHCTTSITKKFLYIYINKALVAHWGEWQSLVPKPYMGKVACGRVQDESVWPVFESHQCMFTIMDLNSIVLDYHIMVTDDQQTDKYRTGKNYIPMKTGVKRHYL